ncbi:MAG: short-chain dehydrogenase [Acidobacteria bacterium]|nr:MAG: short-chain dehydrogenase [Acidobacteriota bacterium]
MEIKGKKILVLGGYGLVGMAVCRELMQRKPEKIIVHSLHQSESEEARDKLKAEYEGTVFTAASGDIFGQMGEQSLLEKLKGQLGSLTDDMLQTFSLYKLLQDEKPDILIDCINTSTAIAYRNIYKTADTVLGQLSSETLSDDAVESLLDSIYIPRLIRHIQILYRGMKDCGTKFYVKVGTTGTGGMGLNIPYTHSEEKPSRVLLSKSALGGAHSLLLFLMARTPDAPITKELKPAAAIGWKKIAYGEIKKKGQPIQIETSRPVEVGSTFSTHDPNAAERTQEVLKNVFIDTGENGIFSLEEFSALTTGEQMEFVTPEEIAKYLVFEIEGGNTGMDVVNALDNATIGPSYRAGLMRHWALEQMVELEQKHDTFSVAYEMLGPPRLSKLLFEAHLLRIAFGDMVTVRKQKAEHISEVLTRLIMEKEELANQMISVGFPILLPDGKMIRGTKVIIPSEADNVEVTEEKKEQWIYDGWVDLRVENCQAWIDRFIKIHNDLKNHIQGDTSSRYLRNERFWHHEDQILPGKVVGWIFAKEEKGARMK